MWAIAILSAIRISFYATSAFGLAYIVGHSVISLGARLWLARPAGPGRELFYCPWCPSTTGPHVCNPSCRPEWHHCSRDHSFSHSGGVGGIGVATSGECAAAPRSRIRDFLVELLECPMCFGTWTGLAVGLLMPTLLPVELPRAAAGLALATFTAASNYFLARATGLVPSSKGDP